MASWTVVGCSFWKKAGSSLGHGMVIPEGVTLQSDQAVLDFGAAVNEKAIFQAGRAYLGDAPHRQAFRCLGRRFQFVCVDGLVGFLPALGGVHQF